MHSRRDFLKVSAGGLLLAGGIRGADPAAWADSLGPAALPSGALQSAQLEALPGKLPLVRKSFRPPNFETPVRFFNEAFTPNDAFFVRYHLADIPQVSAQRWKLALTGDALDKPFEITYQELSRDFEQVEVAAVCMCSGNRRGLSQPHVPGVQWGHGAIGNARWRGVRLRDLLARAGVRKDALEIVFDGADRGVLDKTPDFVKSIPAWKAMDENTLVALEMNGEKLPHWNGFPARIVVPGWTATYWMKHLTSIAATAKPYQGFWMNPAYRIPKGKFALVDRFVSQETEVNTPITEMVVNSLVTNLEEGQKFALGQEITFAGVAWDGGFGIASVEVSEDGGRNWRAAQLASDLGRFSWRQWSHRLTPGHPGSLTLMARATNRAGATQTFELIFNPAGYHNNVVQRVNVEIT
ncbi:MAG: molybdopterin-dependent oxidoreductase [Betaproteobacteria bacterium]